MATRWAVLVLLSLVVRTLACASDASSIVGPSHIDASVDRSHAPDATPFNCGLVTCASVGATCGPIGDGCNNVLLCGTCVAPQTCGGGGMHSQCGGSSGCIPRTCAEASATCGPVADGCGGLLQCGTCPSGQSCGVGGVPNQCADGGDAGIPCAPRTCAQAHATCGPVADGCGGLLDCGSCPSGTSCGGGGVRFACGYNGCTPRSCFSAGTDCGPVADGCGGLIDCGACAPGQYCGAITPSVCGTPGAITTCTGLCLQRASCASGATTTISGTVVSPALVAPDPLYNAVVYIPNVPVAPFTPGVTCGNCGEPTSGEPIVSAITRPDGTFTLINVPIGNNIPLVIQIGRWRRQVTISTVSPCVDNPLPTTLTRLPRNHTEGDIPLMAMVTGDVDTLECVLRKIGIDDDEFTTPAGGGRVQFYIANGATLGPDTPTSQGLYLSPPTLAAYDMVLLACEGHPFAKDPVGQRNLVNYANLGGRVFATHYSYTWLYNIDPFSGTALWHVNQMITLDTLTGVINTGFPRGLAFAQWLAVVGAQSSMDEILIHQPRFDLDNVIAPSVGWISTDEPNSVQHMTFNTPIGTDPNAQCGRVLFSDFHVADGMAMGVMFPTECDTGPLTPQEKVLEFMLFDLASCVAPDIPVPTACVPTTCMAAHATCGPIGDGCGGTLECGACAAGLTCGGGGNPSVCGTYTCMPASCASQGFTCGAAGDGCGGTVQCGTCASGTRCGGGGTPGVCGTPYCVPTTCAALDYECGATGDGCGGVLFCGNCTFPDTCGSGSSYSRCARGPCTPQTCERAGAMCGVIADGCGGAIFCGNCAPGTTCGGAGVPNECAVPVGAST